MLACSAAKQQFAAVAETGNDEDEDAVMLSNCD